MKMNQKGRGNDEFCTPDYARNFICDFILGKTQHNLLQQKLF